MLEKTGNVFFESYNLLNEMLLFDYPRKFDKVLTLIY